MPTSKNGSEPSFHLLQQVLQRVGNFPGFEGFQGRPLPGRCDVSDACGRNDCERYVATSRASNDTHELFSSLKFDVTRY